VSKILIVDDEPDLIYALQESLAADKALFDVVTAENGREALMILAREDVHLVVADINMPEMNGIELLDEIKRRYPEIGVILMSAYGTEKLRQEIRQTDCLHFIEKPFSIMEFRQLLHDCAEKECQGFAGTLKNIQLEDIIQMCCLSMTSMVIRVKKGLREGTIVINEGEIIHAVHGSVVGEEAFYEIIAWESGSFETLGHISEPIVSIQKGWQHLIMEAARLKDERDNQEEKKDVPTKAASLPEVSQAKNEKLRVLIVDDSTMMCNLLTRMLSTDDAIEIIGTANNGEQALEKIGDLKPDLITLDVNMPVMDGSTALKHIMIKSPCPVVIISSIGKQSIQNILDFLRLGAVDFIGKPVKNEDMLAQEQKMIQHIRLAARAKVENFRRVKTPKVIAGKNSRSSGGAKSFLFSPSLVVVNSGIGGYAELIRLVPMLENSIGAAVVLLQTMPQQFLVPFCEYLDQRSSPAIRPLDNTYANRKAIQDESVAFMLEPGSCYVGTHQQSLNLDIVGKEYLLFSQNEQQGSLSGSLGDEHNSSFDDFLVSIAEVFFGDILIVLLSGAEIGNLTGLKSIKEKKGRIIIQQLATCVIPQSLEKAVRERLISAEANPKEIVNEILAI
jgi:two-component system chemotaxis response regulator CheB